MSAANLSREERARLERIVHEVVRDAAKTNPSDILLAVYLAGKQANDNR